MRVATIVFGASITLFGVNIESGFYENVQDKIDTKSHNSVVVLGTNWCPVCQMTKDTINGFEESYNSKAKFFYVDIDSDEDAKSKFSVKAIPVILFIDKNGSIKEQKIGGTTKVGFDKAFERLSW